MKRKLSLIVIIILIANFTCVYFLFKSSHTYSVKLNGNDNITLSYKADYEDEGFTLYNSKRILDKEESEYSIISNVDTNVLGEYKIEYTVKYNGKEYKLERVVKVVDNTAPVIETTRDNVEKSYCSGEVITSIDYKATDDLDGDVTDKVVKEEKDGKVYLSVTDSNGNKTTLELPIVDKDKPSNKIVLNGSSSVNIGLNSNYTEEGAYYSDGCGNKIDDEIDISGSVDTSNTGTYKITYTSKTDNSVTATRTVNVYNMPSSYAAPYTGNSIIYLTFDDGPGAYTRSILDTLDKYNVKATFFVTNQFPGYQNLIAEEANRGHTIGVHSKTHSWSIYHSLDNYWADFDAMNDIIEKQTGKRTSILRFPGGTSNHVAKIGMSNIVNSVNSKGYQYYDWNVCVEDAGACVSSNDKQTCVYNYFKNYLKPGRDNIVLLHDIKSYTAQSLDKMIQYGLNNGYTFRAIDGEAAAVHFKPYK